MTNALEEVLPAFRLLVLRWLTMLSYSTCYVVVPALIFDRTRSASLAGGALVAEGLMRAVVTLFSGQMHAKLGSRGSLWAAEGLRAAAIALFAGSLFQFHLAMVVAGSLLYQIGFALLQLKQEIRCAQLGDQAARCQFKFRLVEMGVVPFVLVLALAGRSVGTPYGFLLVSSFAAALVQLVLALHWLPQPLRTATRAREPLNLRVAWSYLASNHKRAASVGAVMIGFGFFGWAMGATPFLVEGRELFGLTLASPSGIALFKFAVAITGMATTLVVTPLLRNPIVTKLLPVSVIATPFLFLGGLLVDSSGLAVLFFSLGCALLFAAVSWHRAWRQESIPEQDRRGFTALYLSLEISGTCFAGLVLLSGHPLLGCVIAIPILAWLLWPFVWTRAAPGLAAAKPVPAL